MSRFNGPDSNFPNFTDPGMGRAVVATSKICIFIRQFMLEVQGCEMNFSVSVHFTDLSPKPFQFELTKCELKSSENHFIANW